LEVPKQVQPEEGIFLEFAPIARSYSRGISDSFPNAANKINGTDPNTNAGYLDVLRENLAVFPKATAQVLEYWLDVSLFSKWTRPAVKLPWNALICQEDIAAYRQLGIQNFATFATYIDRDYVDRYGDVQEVLNQYGHAFHSPQAK
jgi:hypothetical protein